MKAWLTALLEDAGAHLGLLHSQENWIGLQSHETRSVVDPVASLRPSLPRRDNDQL